MGIRHCIDGSAEYSQSFLPRRRRTHQMTMTIGSSHAEDWVTLFVEIHQIQ